MAAAFVDIDLQRTCTAPSRMRPKRHTEGVCEVNPHSANLHGLPKSLRSEVQNGYWRPTLGITLQRKGNLATAAKREIKS